MGRMVKSCSAVPGEEPTLRKVVGLLVVGLLAAAVPHAVGVVGEPAAAARRVDPALTTQLAESDTSDASAPLTVFVHADDAATAARAASTSGLRTVATWELVGVVVATGPADAVRRVTTAPGVTYVEADRPMSFFLDTSHVATRGEEALQGFSISTTQSATKKNGKPDKGGDPVTVTETSAPVTGEGVSVAIVDSGIDGTHPFFVQNGSSTVIRNVKMVCPDPQLCEGAPSQAEFVNVPGNDSDSGSMGGHGTHVAGIAGGGFGETADGRKLHGAAPGVRLIGVSAGQALSMYGGYAGLNWVLEHHEDPCADGGPTSTFCPPIRVVNNSWGPAGGGEYDPNGVGAKLQDALVAAGVTVVWAAGNDGGDGSTNATNPPGQSPTPGVLSVANYDDGDTGTRDGGLDPTSSRAERHRPATYPDISAPGATITSSCRPTLPVCYLHADTGDDSRLYYNIGGTSMAAPHIAGIVAQLLSADPTLTPGAIEDILEDTAHKFAAGAAYEPDPRNADDTTSFDKGHGLVDVVEAVARVRGMGAPSTASVCSDPAAPVIVDEAGDATDLLVATPGPSEPGVDVTSAWLTWDGSAVTFHIKVSDLRPEPPTASTGEFFDFNFSFGGGGYYVDAIRSRIDGEQYILGRFETARTTLATLTGSFDDATDEITIKLPADAIAKAIEGAPVIVRGSVLGGFGITSRREMGAVVPNADDADATCPYTVGYGTGIDPDAPPPPQATSRSVKPDGSVTAGSPYEWDGGPVTDAYVTGCAGWDDEFCDTRYVDVVVPAGGGTLAVAIGSTSVIPVDDFDLAVYDPDGARVASENAFSEERVEVPVTTSGIYTIQVRPSTAVESTYHGVAAIS